MGYAVKKIARRGAVLLLLGSAASVLAQSNTTAPRVIPGLGDFSLPSAPRPTPTPTPEPTVGPLHTTPPPVVAATPVPQAAAPTPQSTPTATPVARATVPAARATPVPRATPTAAPTPVATTPAPVPTTPVTVPSPIAPPTATSTVAAAAPAETTPSTVPWLPIGGDAGLLIFGAAGAFYMRGRRVHAAREGDVLLEERPHVVEPEAVPAASPSAPVQPAAPPPPPAAPATPPSFLSPAPKAQPTIAPSLDIALRPKRAGTNLTGAAVEYDILISNHGDAPATAIRLDARLLSASAQQDEVLAALFADTIERSVSAPFDLPAGQTVAIGGKAILPRAMVAPLRAGDNRLFVPVLSVNLRYGRGEADGQTARAFMIGVAPRGEGAKLGPFALDTARMREDVAAIVYSMKVDA